MNELNQHPAAMLKLDRNPPEKTPERLYLIDGSGYIFRAYYAIRPLSTSSGLPTNAVFGFARMLSKLLTAKQPTLLGIAFDNKMPTNRHTLYPLYKANRQAPPEDLVPQFSLIHRLVESLSIPVLIRPGYEADDILVTLAHKAVLQGYTVTLVSGDKDLLQAVSEDIEVFDPLRDELYHIEEVVGRFGVPPKLLPDVQALEGDSVDNIPGVPKVGKKTASKLVAAHGDIEQIIAFLQAKKATATESLKAYELSILEHQEEARLSKQLATLSLEAPVDLDLTGLRYRQPDPEKLLPFLQEIEAYGLIKDFYKNAPVPLEASNFKQLAPAAAASAAPPQSPTNPTNLQLEFKSLPEPEESASANAAEFTNSLLPSNYQTLTTSEALADFIRACEREQIVSVDLETTSLNPNLAKIVGIALCTPSEPAVYIPLGHVERTTGDLQPGQLSLESTLESLRKILTSKQIKKYGQNLKYDYIIFSRYGINLENISGDSMLAAYVLDPSSGAYGLDHLARRFLKHQNITYAEVTANSENPKQPLNFAEVDILQATAYAGEDAAVALALNQILTKDLEQNDVKNIYHDIELPLIPVLAHMEKTGILIDTQILNELRTELAFALSKIEDEVEKHLGYKINLASPKQLAEVFFTKLGFPIIRKNKTGPSTDQAVLEILAETYELPAIVLQHRLLSKLKSTYVDNLPQLLNPLTGRLHTHYNQTGTATGRISSDNPNLQNIPIRTDYGKRIRRAFIAKPGHLLLSADYSQIELRVLAHLCADESFVEAFKRGEDIHQRTAKEILSKGAAPSAEMRARAKAINFGILYGLSEFGLSKQLKISRAEAKEFITTYFARYPKIKTFFQELVTEATRTGYVSTLYGRKRYVPELQSKNQNIQRGAERIVMNTAIQGTAADIIKIAMIEIFKALKESHYQSRLLLQVHDELVFECPEHEVEKIQQLAIDKMSSAAKLRVPLTVDTGYAPNWADA